jgi:N-acetylglucosaminyl-diphospho-decaprenol L-rhamnosyltransferase
MTQTPAGDGLLIVIVNYRSARLTTRCLASLEPELARLPGARVAVVDNASGDAAALAGAIRQRGWGAWARLVVAERNGGFAYGNNRAIRPALAGGAPPRYVVLLNPDTAVFPGALRALLDFMDGRPDVGIAGSGLVNEDGTDWPIAFRFPTLWSELEQGLRFGPVSRLLSRYRVAREMPQDRPAAVDWVAGASMIVRREVWRDAGLMDEGYFLYFEETDFCLQARRAGWPCWYVPASRVMHESGQCTGVSARRQRPGRRPAYWFASRRRYFVKNHGPLYARLADLAFGLGYALWRLRRVLQRKPDTDPPHLLRDFVKYNLFRSRKGSVTPQAAGTVP